MILAASVPLVLVLCLFARPSEVQAQAAATASEAARPPLVERTFTSINYQYRSGSTRIDFKGSSLASTATGQAEVEGQRGYTRVEVEFRGLSPARTFGPEYFTYVLWAITPQGRAQNLGELVLNRDRSSLTVTTELQAFALLVTAEPYFAISQPSDVVVLEKVVRPDTRGRIEEVQARSELIARGAFLAQEKPDELTARLMVVDARTPLELYQARNAVRLVRWAGAETHAKETFDKAVELLIQAENYQARRNPQTRPATMIARQAVQAAEDARLITIERAAEARQALERAQAAKREAAALSLAESEAGRRAQAEVDLSKAEQARTLAEQLTVQAEAARAQAEAARAQAEVAAAQAGRVRAEAEGAAETARRDRAEAEMARLAALKEVEQTREEARALQARVAEETAAADRARAAAMAELERIKQESAAQVAKLDAARADAIRQQQAAESEAAHARTAAEVAQRLREQAEGERAQIRQRLQEQLNRVLETTNTARGLIVNLSDVQFDTAKFTLRPGAREKLARISGILSIQPGLRVEVEGHTDSVGTSEYNQELSEQRATAVRAYLVEQGIDSAAISARGFGESRPAVTNDTAAGRQQNRRVELVVSGEAIDSTAVAPTEGSVTATAN